MTSRQRCISCRVIRNTRDFLTINGSLQAACKNCCYLNKQRKAKDSRIKEYVKFPREGNIMFLDTETNGLPVELDNFLLYDPRRCLKAYNKARLTSLAYIVTTNENMVILK